MFVYSLFIQNRIDTFSFGYMNVSSRMTKQVRRQIILRTRHSANSLRREATTGEARSNRQASRVNPRRNRRLKPDTKVDTSIPD